MKKLVYLVVLLSISFVLGSSSDVDLTIDGCFSNDYSLLFNTCSVDGFAYCLENGTLIDSIVSGCSIDSSCCPANFICEEGVCNQRTITCSEHTNKSDCEEVTDQGGCFWFEAEDEGICVSDPSEGNCGIYSNAGSCEKDIFNFGQTGEEAEDLCGTYASGGQTIPLEACSCEWDGNSCEFSYDVFEQIGDLSFNCKKSFDIGECSEGTQTISWTVSFTPSYTPSTKLTDASCFNSSKTRGCGGASTKLPGFSHFALILAILIIVVYYMLYLNKSKNKKRK
jgi:hypothetical protein